MCKILLSINPEHVDHILDGSKEYEFRKTKCKEEIDGIIIYCTAPVKQVIAEVNVAEILEDTPKKIWHGQKNRELVQIFSLSITREGKRQLPISWPILINLMNLRCLLTMAYWQLRSLLYMYKGKRTPNLG